MTFTGVESGWKGISLVGEVWCNWISGLSQKKRGCTVDCAVSVGFSVYMLYVHLRVSIVSESAFKNRKNIWPKPKRWKKNPEQGIGFLSKKTEKALTRKPTFSQVVDCTLSEWDQWSYCSQAKTHRGRRCVWTFLVFFSKQHVIHGVSFFNNCTVFFCWKSTMHGWLVNFFLVPSCLWLSSMSSGPCCSINVGTPQCTFKNYPVTFRDFLVSLRSFDLFSSSTWESRWGRARRKPRSATQYSRRGVAGTTWDVFEWWFERGFCLWPMTHGGFGLCFYAGVQLLLCFGLEVVGFRANFKKS